MMRLNSLRARMTAAVTISFAVWMVLVCVGVTMYLGRADRRRVDRLLTATAVEIARDSAIEAREERLASEADAAAAYCDEHRESLAADHLSLLLLDAQGNVSRRYLGTALPWPRTADDDWQTRLVPLGRYNLVVGFDWGRTEHEARERTAALLAVSLCVVLAAALGAWVLVGRTLLPIRHLSDQASASAPEALHVRLKSPSQDAEIVGLVSTLNGLLGRLGQIAAAKGHFYAAASHELRTPLQALSGHLEVALSRSRTADEYRGALQEADIQTHRLISLVRDLLLLNQLDAPTVPAMQEQVSLAEVAELALRQVAPTIADRHLHLTTELEQDGEVLAPRLHAEMLLRNVIENAVQYASVEGEVRLSLRETPGHVSLEVYNTCPPVPDWDSEALFEPFVRLDTSRNHKTGGNGLGLAICKAIAVANGWSLTLAHDGEGVRATLDVPTPA